MQKSRKPSVSTLRGVARDGKDKDAEKVLKVCTCSTLYPFVGSRLG